MFDLTAKKKKKTKKFEFTDEDDKNIDGDSGTKGEAGDVADGVDDIGDLNDFTGLKKKKKKKKPFNLDELEANLPPEGNDDSQKASPGDEKGDDSQVADLVDDLDFDFSSKKKKKKKKTTFDLPDQDDNADKENEGDAFDDDFTRDELSVGGQSKWHDSDRDYTYDELLEIIYNKIKEKNPESETGTKKKLVMRPPQVLRVGTKKTSFANFLEICKS